MILHFINIQVLKTHIFKNILSSLILVLLLKLVSVEANAQITARIDSLASTHVKKGFNGNILYSKNGSILFTGNYGYADILNKKPLNDSTIFELASCSKQFTALAIVQLAERKLVSYNSKVSEYIHGFPYEDITIEHLLRHQSGLPDFQKLLYKKKNWRNRKKMATHNDVIALLAKLDLDLHFKPGTKYVYNNTGYAVLATIIERVSKQSYEAYITENIFIPAGMKTARVYNHHTINTFQNVADGFTYNHKKKKYQKIEKDKNHKHVKWMDGIIGGSGIYASILDLEKWKKALRNNILITKKSMDKMISVDAVSKKYGFGFAIYDTKSKGKYIYHNGSWSGYKTMTIYLPKTNEYLVILSNNRYKETYKSFEDDLYKLIQ